MNLVCHNILPGIFHQIGKTKIVLDCKGLSSQLYEDGRKMHYISTQLTKSFNKLGEQLANFKSAQEFKKIVAMSNRCLLIKTR